MLLTAMNIVLSVKLLSDFVKDIQPKEPLELVSFEWFEEPLSIQKIVWTGSIIGPVPVLMDEWHGYAMFREGNNIREVDFYHSAYEDLQFSAVIPNVTKTGPACIILSPNVREYSEEGILTVLYHEFGHIVNGDMDCRGKSNTFGKRIYTMELAADRYAVEKVSIEVFVKGMQCLCEKEFGDYFSSFCTSVMLRQSATSAVAEISRRLNDLGSDQYNALFYSVVKKPEPMVV